MNTPHRELQSCPGTPGDGLLLVSGFALVSHGALGTLARQPFSSFARHVGCCYASVLVCLQI